MRTQFGLIEFVEGTLTLEKLLPKENIQDFLKSTSYEKFLREYVDLAENTSSLWNTVIGVTFCLGADSISIAEAVKWGSPGFSVLGQEVYEALADTMILEDSDVVWMPDGNASLARQIVRRLIPAVAPGNTIEDLVTAGFNVYPAKIERVVSGHPDVALVALVALDSTPDLALPLFMHISSVSCYQRTPRCGSCGTSIVAVD